MKYIVFVVILALSYSHPISHTITMERMEDFPQAIKTIQHLLNKIPSNEQQTANSRQMHFLWDRLNTLKSSGHVNAIKIKIAKQLIKQFEIRYNKKHNNLEKIKFVVPKNLRDQISKLETFLKSWERNGLQLNKRRGDIIFANLDDFKIELLNKELPEMKCLLNRLKFKNSYRSRIGNQLEITLQLLQINMIYYQFDNAFKGHLIILEAEEAKKAKRSKEQSKKKSLRNYNLKTIFQVDQGMNQTSTLADPLESRPTPFDEIDSKPTPVYHARRNSDSNSKQVPKRSKLCQTFSIIPRQET